MSACGIFISVALLMLLQSACLVTGVMYKCEVTGDPHLTSFGGQRDSVAIPCAFFVTSLRLKNLVNVQGKPAFTEIYIEVHAGNSQHTINGRYYTSDVFVSIAYSNGTGQPIANNTYYIGEKRIGEGKVWVYDPSEHMQFRVEPGYVRATDIAFLQILSTSFQLQFRRVNRSEGNHQSKPPGITVVVGSQDLIYDPKMKFPNTLCSTINDTGSIDQVGKKEDFQHRIMGIYAVLDHMAYSIPDGDQSPLCPAMMGKYKMCDKAKKESFQRCFGLMRSAKLVRCLEGIPTLELGVPSATDSCLDFYCSGGPINCDRLQNYTETCPDLLRMVDNLPCPFMQNITRR